jgi:hypothetical protein
MGADCRNRAQSKCLPKRQKNGRGNGEKMMSNHDKKRGSWENQQQKDHPQSYKQGTIYGGQCDMRYS